MSWVLALTLAGATDACASSTELRALVEQLAGADESTREEARMRLMELPASRLTELRDAVADLRPLAPGQEELLQDIVLHVHVSGSYARVRDGPGFLGIQSTARSAWAALDDGEGGMVSPGVVIDTRLFGFGAFRALRDGDVIVGTSEIPGLRMRNIQQLRAVIERLPPRGTVLLKVQRGGRLLDVPVRLTPIPPADPRVQGRIMQQEELRAAVLFWESEFVPLLQASGG
jgi:hypothetical protein